MSPTAKAGLRLAVGLGLGGLLFYLVFRRTNVTEVVSAFRQLHPGYLVLGMFVMLLSHVVRAARWRDLLAAAGERIPLGTAFAAVMTGYVVNYGVPRLGEVVRCSLVYRNHRTPLTTSAGTVVVDRVADVVVLLVLLILLGLLEADLLARLVAQWGLRNPTQWLLTAGAAAAAGAVAAGLAWRYRRRLATLPVLKTAIGLAEQVVSAMTSIRRLRSPARFVGYTALIWVGYWLSTVWLLQSHAPSHGYYFGLVLMLLGAVGMALPSPGGVGSFHAAIQLGFLGYGLSGTAGALAALIIHSSQLVATVVVGLLSYLYLTLQPPATAQKPESLPLG